MDRLQNLGILHFIAFVYLAISVSSSNFYDYYQDDYQEEKEYPHTLDDGTFGSLSSSESEENGTSTIKPNTTSSSSEEDPHRIVNGRPAKPGEVPYQLSLLLDREHHCGASLVVSPISGMQYGITAAHCVTNVNRGGIMDRYPQEYLVGGGSVNRNDGQYLTVAHIMVHENWRAENHFDIALLFFQGQFQLTDEFYPVEVSTIIDEERFREIWVSGWGVTHEGGEVAPIHLQILRLPRLRTRYCNKIYQRLRRTRENVVDVDQVCAGYNRGGKDACQGDSGGPAVAKDGNRGKYLVGIVSFGEGCARPGVPGIFTRVSYFHDWIVNHVAEYERYGLRPGHRKRPGGHSFTPRREGKNGRSDTEDGDENGDDKAGKGTAGKPGSTGKPGTTTGKPGTTAKPGTTKKP